MKLNSPCLYKYYMISMRRLKHTAYRPGFSTKSNFLKLPNHFSSPKPSQIPSLLSTRTIAVRLSVFRKLLHWRLVSKFHTQIVINFRDFRHFFAENMSSFDLVAGPEALLSTFPFVFFPLLGLLFLFFLLLAFLLTLLLRHL